MRGETAEEQQFIKSWENISGNPGTDIPDYLWNLFDTKIVSMLKIPSESVFAEDMMNEQIYAWLMRKCVEQTRNLGICLDNFDLEDQIRRALASIIEPERKNFIIQSSLISKEMKKAIDACLHAIREQTRSITNLMTESSVKAKDTMEDVIKYADDTKENIFAAVKRFQEIGKQSICEERAKFENFKKEMAVAKEQYASGLSTTAREYLRSNSRLSFLKWISASCLCIAIFCLATFFMSFSLGKDRGELEARERFGEFVASPIGKKAEALYRNKKLKGILDFGTSKAGIVAKLYDDSQNTLLDILLCKRQGWQTQNGACFPSGSEEGFWMPDGIIK